MGPGRRAEEERNGGTHLVLWGSLDPREIGFTFRDERKAFFFLVLSLFFLSFLSILHLLADWEGKLFLRGAVLGCQEGFCCENQRLAGRMGLRASKESLSRKRNENISADIPLNRPLG